MKSSIKRFGLICLAAVLFSGLLISCTAPSESTVPPVPESIPPSTQASKAPFPMEMTDQLGRVVTLETAPQRIVSLAPSNTEIVFALGLADRLVAVTNYCDYPPEAGEKPSIGGYSTPNIEEIVAMGPDLILATTIHEKKVIPQLEAKGLTVVAIAPKSLDEVLDGIQIVGEVTGEEEKASELLTDMRNRIKAVTDKTASLPEDQRPGVFYLTWHDPLMTSGVGTLHDELIHKAGGTNIFPEVVGTKSIDLEMLVARDPQVMVAGIGMGTGEEKTLEFLKTESRLQDTEAARNGRIYGIDLDLTGRAGPRIVTGLERFARCVHPEIFGAPDSE
jgi:iron complex transport system substrate-binding protein